MKCYKCDKDYTNACECEDPAVLICDEHFSEHISIKGKRHIIINSSEMKKKIEAKIVEARNFEAKLMSETREQLLKIRERIILNSREKLKILLMNTKKSLKFVGDLLEKVYKKNHENELNKEFADEIVVNCISILDDDESKKNAEESKCVENKHIIRTSDGIFEGEVLKINEGNGIYKYNNDSIYEGYFKNSLAEGYGKYSGIDNTFYEGEFKNGCKEGKGIYIFDDGRAYEGEFKNNLIEGRGKLTYIDCSIYEGDFVNEQREGKGVYTLADGVVYTGEWKNGLADGNGCIKLANGDIELGIWREGMKI